MFKKANSTKSNSSHTTNTVPNRNSSYTTVPNRNSSYTTSSSVPPPYQASVPMTQTQTATPSRFATPGTSAANPSRFANAHMSASQKYGIPPERLSVLKGYDVLFLVDDSWSMNEEGGSRITQVRETITMFTEVACEYDDDGVDLCFLNNVHIQATITNPPDVQAIMSQVRWDGATPIGRRLSEILGVYYGLLQQDPRTKPLSIVIITDGAPTDKDLVESTIVDCARRMAQRGTPNQVAFQFFQVGNDENARKYLEYLDDNLEAKHRINDIVDCVHCQKGGLTLQDRFIKALVGGIDNSVDQVSGYV